MAPWGDARVLAGKRHLTVSTPQRALECSSMHWLTHPCLLSCACCHQPHALFTDRTSMPLRSLARSWRGVQGTKVCDLGAFLTRVGDTHCRQSVRFQWRCTEPLGFAIAGTDAWLDFYGWA